MSSPARQGHTRANLTGPPRPCGLPLRADTLRAILSHADQPLDAPPLVVELDPGYVVALLQGDSPNGHTLADCQIWPTDGASPARDTLWRHGVATALAARSIAAERGLTPEEIDLATRVGLLHELALWSIAADDPARLARILAPGERRPSGLDRLGLNLAESWGCHPALVDAAWLSRDRSNTELADRPAILATVCAARVWAQRTPWALFADEPPAIATDRLRLLIAQVQVATTGGLAGEPFAPNEAAATRAFFRLQARHDRLAEEAADAATLLRQIADEPAGDRTPSLGLSDLVSRARSAWNALQQSARTLSRRFDGLLNVREAEQSTLQEREAADRLDALAEFAAGAAHELNNPLAVMMGRAQLLLSRADDPDSARSLRAIITQAQRAHRILRDLIYIARPPAPRPRPCQPAEIARVSLRDLSPEARERGVTLDFAPAAGLVGWTALVDPDPLRHLCDVLLRNALEATPAGGTIRLEVRRDRAGRLALAVVDDGPGLDDRTRARLLDPFYCGRQAGRGLGLGLSRAERSVRMAGGSLRIVGAAGGGTAILVTLPLAAESGRDAAPDPRLKAG